MARSFTKLVEVGELPICPFYLDGIICFSFVVQGNFGHAPLIINSSIGRPSKGVVFQNGGAFVSYIWLLNNSSVVSKAARLN